MKSDLDQLMQKRGLNALVVMLDENYSPQMDYLVGSMHVTGGMVMKKPGDAPVIFAHPMEIEEAATTGAKVVSMNEMGWPELLREAENSRTKAEVLLWERCLAHLGVPGGKIGLYGVGHIHHVLEFTRLLQSAYPHYEFLGETGTTLFEEAAITKDADEITRIKSVAARTSQVLQATWDFISSHRAEGDTVVKPDGSPLTIGEVKRFIRLALLERALEDTGMIFAQGRDAGFPHSRGQEGMGLRLGQVIVFDLFPRELGGGYHHDTTRTWCIGHAPDALRETYETVMTAFEIALESYALHKPTYLVQEAVLNHFEQAGHPTSRSAPGTTEGYVHGLGHGVGLKVHESPKISHLSQVDHFQVGNVFTLEPGLYYPEKGLGVRIEDLLYIAEDGQLISLTDFHKDLVLPLHG